MSPNLAVAVGSLALALALIALASPAPGLATAIVAALIIGILLTHGDLFVGQLQNLSAGFSQNVAGGSNAPAPQP